MAVKDADPRAVELDDAFREAMEGPAKPREAAAPPEIDPEAPLGRDESGAPLTPFGLTKDGKVRRTNAGRRAKDETPRTGSRAVPDKGSTPGGKGNNSQPAELEPHDYTAKLSETGDGIWIALSSVAKLPFLPSAVTDRVGAEAAIFRINQAGLVGALDTAAQNNARARALAEKLSKSDVSWVLTCFSLAAPFVVQSAMMLKPGDKPEGFPDTSALAAKNDQDLQDHIQALMLLAEAEAENLAAAAAPADA